MLTKVTIQFDKSIPIKDIQNYNRRNYVGSIERDRTEFLPTPSEIATRQLLESNNVWRIIPHYPLDLLGDCLQQYLKWELAEPVYPLNYRFDCILWADTSYEDIQKALQNIRQLQYIEKVS